MIKLLLKSLLILVLLCGGFLLVAKFTGTGSVMLYENTSWDITGHARMDSWKEHKAVLDGYTDKLKKMPQTLVEFDNETFDFGKITEGEKVSHSYKIKNTGENPLVIAHVQVSCGCTVASFPKEPIAAGKEGNIDIQFDSAHKWGPYTKNILVYSNSPLSPRSIHFKVEVEKK